MNGEDYTTMESDESYGLNGAEAEYESGEVDEMLDSLIDAAGGDFSEARRGRRRGRKPNRRVPTPDGRTAYRDPSGATGGAVSQKQFKEAMDRVAAEFQRTAQGVKEINTRLGTIDRRVDGVVTVATAQSRQLTKIERLNKADGALELVEALNGGQLNAFQLLKGAVKLGFLGDGKGPLSNPLVVGGIGLVLRNPGILGGLTGANAAGGSGSV
jgi:hypothetical protein